MKHTWLLRSLLGLMVLIALPGTGRSQTSPGMTVCSSPTLAASTSSSNTQLSDCAQTAMVWNVGDVEAFVAFGATNTTAATTSSDSIPAGSFKTYLVRANARYIAAITGSSSANLRISVGSGFPGAGGGGGSSGGGGGGDVEITAPLGTNAIANSVAVTPATSSVWPATQSGTWTVQPGNTANTTPWLASIAQGGNTAPVTTAGADGVGNTLGGLQTYARTQCFNGASWDRCTQIGTGTPGSPNTSQVLSNQGVTGGTPTPTVDAVSTISTSITRPSDSAPYSANDAFANSTSAPTAGGFTLTSACRASGGYGTISDVVISASAGTAYQGEIWVFDQAVTAINDNAAFTVSDADILNMVGAIPFQTTMTTAVNAVSINQNLGIGYTCIGTANLRFVVKINSAVTPASAEVLAIRVKVRN